MEEVSIGIYAEESEAELNGTMLAAHSPVTVEVEEVESERTGKKKLEEEEFQVFVVQKSDEIFVYALDEAYAEKTYVLALLENISAGLEAQDMGVDGRMPLGLSVEEVENDFASWDYYGVVIVTMMILYVMIVPLCLFSYDFDHQVVQRICITGFKLSHYYIARIVSSLILEIIIIAPIFLFTYFVLGTNWGDQIVFIGLSLILTALMAVMLGTLIYSIVKNYEKSLILIQTTIIPLWSILGGNYIRLNSENAVINTILWTSPLRWLNQGIFRAVYIDELSTLLAYSGGALIVIVISGAILILKNKEGGVQ